MVSETSYYLKGGPPGEGVRMRKKNCIALGKYLAFGYSLGLITPKTSTVFWKILL